LGNQVGAQQHAEVLLLRHVDEIAERAASIT
jgi:hypothetical protein